MKTCLTSVALFTVLIFGSHRAAAQMNLNRSIPEPVKVEVSEPVKVEVSEPVDEDSKTKAARTFDVVKLEVLQVTKELEASGVKNIPVYPTTVSLETVTAYLQELKALKQTTSKKPN